MPPGRHLTERVKVHATTPGHESPSIHGRQNFPGVSDDKAAGHAPQIAYTVLTLGPLWQAVPGAHSAGLGVKAAHAVQAKARGECGHVRELGNVLHEVADTRAGLLNICHAMGPKRPHDAPGGCAAALVPMGHPHAYRQPDNQVVMHCPALLELSDPEITRRYTDASAPAPEALSSCTNVIWPPVLNAAIRERDHPGHGWALATG